MDVDVQFRNEPKSLASIAFNILDELIQDVIMDVTLEAHREIKMAHSICHICHTKCRQFVSKPGLDIHGNSHTNLNSNSPMYECVICHRQIASNRYAPHLEKCLGLNARSSSRVAKQRGHLSNTEKGIASPLNLNLVGENGSSSNDDGSSGTGIRGNINSKKKKKKSLNGINKDGVKVKSTSNAIGNKKQKISSTNDNNNMTTIIAPSSLSIPANMTPKTSRSSSPASSIISGINTPNKKKKVKKATKTLPGKAPPRGIVVTPTRTSSIMGNTKGKSNMNATNLADNSSGLVEEDAGSVLGEVVTMITQSDVEVISETMEGEVVEEYGEMIISEFDTHFAPSNEYIDIDGDE